jgi:hypothetical protein
MVTYFSSKGDSGMVLWGDEDPVHNAWQGKLRFKGQQLVGKAEIRRMN